MLLLEYGGSDRSIYIQMPSALSIPMNMPNYDWCYHTEPEPHLDGRRLHTPRGKVLGRLLLDQRPRLRARQCARFRALGGARARRAGATATCCRTSSAPRGRAEGGDRLPRRRRPARRRATAAHQSAARRLARRRRARRAIRTPSDVNGFQQEGFGRMDMTVGGGRRCSAANAYLRPAMRRPNLEVRTHALATRIAVRGAARPRAALPARKGATHQRARDARVDPVAADRSTRRSC